MSSDSCFGPNHSRCSATVKIRSSIFMRAPLTPSRPAAGNFHADIAIVTAWWPSSKNICPSWFHAAAHNMFPDGAQPSEAVTNNIHGTRNVVEVAAKPMSNDW